MKERVTYFLPKDSGLHRDEIKLSKDGIEFARADAADREWRVTLDFDELSDKWQNLLANHYYLHIRWESSGHIDRATPFLARLPPGLHVFFSPRSYLEDSRICDIVKDITDTSEIKCSPSYDSFVQPQPSSRDAVLHQYFTQTTRRPRTFGHLLEKVCASKSDRDNTQSACHAFVLQVTDAGYVDLDFDITSRNVILSAYWNSDDDRPPTSTFERADVDSSPPFGVKERIRKVEPEHRLEVGVLQTEEPEQPGYFKVGGYLTVVGEDEKPGATLFSFPSRHHSIPSKSSMGLKFYMDYPWGLHPKMRLTIPRDQLSPPQPNCALHAYLTLPSEVFIDRYQLSDSLTFASHNLVQMKMLQGVDDLEAPEWNVKGWGSVSLFELAHGNQQAANSNPSDQQWSATIPLHLRYLNGSTSPHKATKLSLHVPNPAVFWACEAEEAFKLTTNPFDRTNLGYDRLFEPGTLFYHIQPARDATTKAFIEVPVLEVGMAERIPFATLIVVLLGFGWVCWKLLATTQAAARSHKSKVT